MSNRPSVAVVIQVNGTTLPSDQIPPKYFQRVLETLDLARVAILQKIHDTPIIWHR
jgi:hypothetical protein